MSKLSRRFTASKLEDNELVALFSFVCKKALVLRINQPNKVANSVII